MRYPLIKPSPPLPGEWIKYLDTSYEKSIFCNFGPAVELFQTRIKEALKLSNEPLTCCNATLGLELALMALDLEADAEILVPTFTFAATAHAVERLGYRAILVDSNPDTWHLCLGDAQRRRNKRTAAMIVVHPLGLVTDPLPYIRFCKKHDIQLIFDSAAAFGAVYPFGYTPENSGICEIYSLHITKSLGVGEGGLVVSKDAKFLQKCRRLSNFGLNENAETDMIGTNAKMSDFQAAVGLAVLDINAEILKKRRFLASIYNELFKDNKKIWLQNHAAVELHTYPFYPFRYLGDIDALKHRLSKSEIGFRQYYKPLHLHPLYKKRKNVKHYPVADMLAEQVICLPCYQTLEATDIEFIAKVVNET